MSPMTTDVGYRTALLTSIERYQLRSCGQIILPNNLVFHMTPANLNEAFQRNQFGEFNIRHGG